MINKALQFAIKAHYGQVDKRGKPYIFHPIRMALSLQDPIEKIVALLHDVVEDTNVTLEDIEKEFGSEIAHCVGKLTHEEGVAYMDYVEALSRNKTAKAVKIADLTDNLSPERDYEGRKIDKYIQALNYLLKK